MSLSDFGLPLSENPPEGPQFVDSGNCLCAFQLFSGAQETAAWRCLGNNKKSQNIYQGKSGKWYMSKNGDSNTDPTSLPVSDASFPPDNRTAYVSEQGGGGLVSLDSVNPN